MHTTTQLSFAFIGGSLFGLCVGVVAMFLWCTAADRAHLRAIGSPRHRSPKKYPRPLDPQQREDIKAEGAKRVPGRPTNIDQPPATIRQAQFRATRETKD